MKKRANLKPLHPPCDECGYAWFHGHAANCSKNPAINWRKRKGSA